MEPLFDTALSDQRRHRAQAIAAPGSMFLLEAVITEFEQRLALVQRSFGQAVDLFTPHPDLADILARSGQISALVRLDRIATPAVGGWFAIADAEALPLGRATIDLIVSALGLHFVNDLPGMLAQIRVSLKPDGLFLAAIPGGETLTELRQSLAAAEAEVAGGASPRVGPFAGVPELGALLQRAGFALPVADRERVTARYGNAVALMHDLRAMGATNVLARDRRPLTASTVRRAGEIYAERFADSDGRVPATFDFIWLSGWAPHTSQQQPLRPGSAKARLAEALGVREHSARDKSVPSSDRAQ